MNTSKEPVSGGEDPADESRTGNQGDQPEGPEPEKGSQEVRSAPEESPQAGPSDSDSSDAEPGQQSLPESAAEAPSEEREQRDLDPSELEDDELPEWEPLTPELVEDEAIRGDFMLRWAVVLLAFLLGCTEIAESQTLVHVKTGQYMADHGWLPPREDVFSFTAAERPWINLAWLLDLVLAGVYFLGSQVGLSGAAGLSLLKALAAAVTFGLIVHISRAEVSTWWGSICAALALLGSYEQFTAGPAMITLLGLGVTLWLLHRWRETGNVRTLWLLPGVFLLWSNLDPRLYLGLSLLLLYGAGEALGQWWDRTDFPEGPQQKPFWTVAGVCVLASMMNPFGWHSLTGPLSLYGVEYPALRTHLGGVATSETLAYFPMTAPSFWESLNHQAVAALLVLAAAVAAFILNWPRAKPAHILPFLGFVGFAVAAGHELAAAALVASVVATLNAQQWYQVTFRQTYSVDTSELLFSRGGRALTVLTLFAVAYLAISGWLDGPDGRRTGVGLHPTLQAHIDGLQDDLQDSFDDRPFNFRFAQGDVLIWIGHRPFIDSRVTLYDGTGEENLLRLHDQTRRSLRKPRGSEEPAEQRDIWKNTFDRFQITHALPRLSPPNPDYVTYFDLLASPDDWQLTRLGSMAAVFYRNDTDDPALQEYVSAHRADFQEQAFRATADGPALSSRDWARSRSVYEKYLSLPQNHQPNAIWRAGHYQSHLQDSAAFNVPVSLEQSVGLAYLSIRAANEGLAERPQSAYGYRLLGRAYEFLEEIETQTTGGAYQPWRRFVQTVQAYRQSLLIEPDHRLTHLTLAQYYARHQKYDLALESLKQYQQLAAEHDVMSESEIRLQAQTEQAQQQLNDMVQRVKDQIDEQLEQGADRLAVARRAHQAGSVLQALELLDDESESDTPNLAVQLFQARLLMEAGRARDAFDILAQLESIAEQAAPAGQSGRSPWRSQAALAGLANGRYDRAIQLWSSEVEELQAQQVTSLLQTMPLTGSPLPLPFLEDDSRQLLGWPLLHVRASTSALYEQPAEITERLMNIALCHLEIGQPQAAAATFRRLLKTHPETSLRPLVRVYLFLITDELIDPFPPSDRIPITPDIFAPEPAAPEPVEAEKPAD